MVKANQSFILQNVDLSEQLQNFGKIHFTRPNTCLLYTVKKYNVFKPFFYGTFPVYFADLPVFLKYMKKQHFASVNNIREPCSKIQKLLLVSVICLFITSCLIFTTVILVHAFLDSSCELASSLIMAACPQRWMTQVKIAFYNRSMHY